MAKNDFRMTSIFKIIIRICMKKVFTQKMSVHFLRETERDREKQRQRQRETETEMCTPSMCVV